MTTLLGLDLGTSSMKVSAYRDTGEHLGTTSCSTPWQVGRSGAELDSSVFADKVRDAIEKCASRFALDSVAGIGITGMAETIFVETVDGVTHSARAWNDRGGPAELPDPELFEQTGLLDVTRTSAVRLRNLCDSGERVRSWSGVPEYAVRVLGGDSIAERSLASRSGLVDVRAGDWSEALLTWARVSDVPVPALSHAGTPAGVMTVGPCAGAVLTVAGHDHLTAALGAGAADDTGLFDSLGTGEGIVAEVLADNAQLSAADLRRLTAEKFNVGLGLRETNVILLAGLGTGNRLNLILAALAANGFGRADVIDSLGRRSDPDAALTGELAELVETLGAENWQSVRDDIAAIVARNVLDLATAQALWWAEVARVTLNARDVLNSLSRLVPRATRLIAAGGWLGNEGIRDVREALLGPFEVFESGEAGTRGAALLAGLASGVYASRTDFPPPNSREAIK
ncbi:FGGY family carbohydrate kinase [Subtercola lobariae]|uniref:Carbohydrate kinase FGGY N-terminal domain-containing protein n=1 Tax=Subtercola lobariae TaxID=1588641 RepID=A0A917B2E5_9MICO|nr:FGGY family carbohydrate kinase [Subtercola lobariae]GGF18341.1 hypothetical protein GCM10011399_10060 [Subtercola lobariae]